MEVFGTCIKYLRLEQSSLIHKYCILDSIMSNLIQTPFETFASEEQSGNYMDYID